MKTMVLFALCILASALVGSEVANDIRAVDRKDAVQDERSDSLTVRAVAVGHKLAGDKRVLEASLQENTKVMQELQMQMQMQRQTPPPAPPPSIVPQTELRTEGAPQGRPGQTRTRNSDGQVELFRDGQWVPFHVGMTRRKDATGEMEVLQNIIMLDGRFKYEWVVRHSHQHVGVSHQQTVSNVVVASVPDPGPAVHCHRCNSHQLRGHACIQHYAPYQFVAPPPVVVHRPQVYCPPVVYQPQHCRPPLIYQSQACGSSGHTRYGNSYGNYNRPHYGGGYGGRAPGFNWWDGDGSSRFHLGAGGVGWRSNSGGFNFGY